MGVYSYVATTWERLSCNIRVTLIVGTKSTLWELAYLEYRKSIMKRK